MDLAAGLASGEVSYVRTSGTADEALTNIWNQAWWDASERASWALNAVAARAATGTHREAILASALSVGPRSDGGASAARAADARQRFLFLNEYGLRHGVARGARAADPRGARRAPAGRAWRRIPRSLRALARFAERTGIGAFQPKLITLTYEFPSACSCARSDGLHVSRGQLLRVHRSGVRVHGVRARPPAPEHAVLQGGHPAARPTARRCAEWAGSW